MARDIAQDTLNVGNALANVRIDQMILNLAKGIAWGQYELDKVGVDITKMMGVPGTVSIGGDKISLLEAGFVPSFYHFVDTILELKMEINIREEESSKLATVDTTSGSSETSFNTEFSLKSTTKGGFNVGFASGSQSVEVGVKAGFSQKSTSAYSRSVDASHAQKFSQDLSASSLMRTKLVPVPPPEILLERITMLLEKLRKEAEEGEAKSEQKALDNLGNLILTIGTTTELTIDEKSLDDPSDKLKEAIYEAFEEEEEYVLLKKMEITFNSEDTDTNATIILKKWIVKDRAENKYILVWDKGNADQILAYNAGETKDELFDLAEMFSIE